MLFPSSSKRFLGIISEKKNENYNPARSIKEETELIEKSYGSTNNNNDSDAIKSDSNLGLSIKNKKGKRLKEEVDSNLDLPTKIKNKKAKRLKEEVDSELDLPTKIRNKKGKRLKEVESELGLQTKIKNKKGKRLNEVESELGLPLEVLKPTEIKKGNKLEGGFKRFLSNNGRTNHLVRFKKGCYGQVEDVDFDSLCGKYLLICCFSVPMFSDERVADECRAIIETYDHLSRDGHPFEMVVVVKMRSDATYDQKAAFDHFYSAFSCLAIPFSDADTRDYICSCFMNLAILVDPKGLILEKDDTLEHFLYHGSEWTPPFLDTTLGEIFYRDHALRSRLDPMYALAYRIVNEDQRYLSLYGDILLCDPYRVLRRFDAETDVASTVLDLTSKYVGLYLCFDGSIMEEIKAAHDYCLANKQQLEIILVCMSLFDEPNSYYEDLYQTLRLFNIKSWFLFDYDSKVCRRMWRIFGEGYLWPGEKFIVIPPNCESAELRARDIIIKNGITEYPFTRTALLKRRLEFVRSLTPVHLSLFKTGLFQNGEEFNSEQLRGKNLLLYLDSHLSNPQHCYNLLMKHYPKMKAMGWEIVFVPVYVVTYTERFWNRQMVERVVHHHRFRMGSNVDEMPWLVMSPPAAVEASVEKQLTFPEERHYSRLVAVGKDGNIVSRHVEDKLKTHGVTESLFDDVLESDLALELASMPQIDDDYYN